MRMRSVTVPFPVKELRQAIVATHPSLHWLWRSPEDFDAHEPDGP
eukprot:gene9102-18282_t